MNVEYVMDLEQFMNVDVQIFLKIIVIVMKMQKIVRVYVMDFHIMINVVFAMILFLMIVNLIVQVSGEVVHKQMNVEYVMALEQFMNVDVQISLKVIVTVMKMQKIVRVYVMDLHIMINVVFVMILFLMIVSLIVLVPGEVMQTQMNADYVMGLEQFMNVGVLTFLKVIVIVMRIQKTVQEHVAEMHQLITAVFVMGMNLLVIMLKQY